MAGSVAMIPVVAITAVRQQMLVCHYFDSEEELLRTKPFVVHWKRETFDSRHIRYHSKHAERYWKKRFANDKIISLAIHYKNGKEVKRYYQ